MPSDNQQSQAGYFKGTLISGLTPFLYRGRVRSLLGFPAARTNKVSACTVIPPVGFRYQNQPILAGRPGANQFIEATAQKNSCSRLPDDRPRLDNFGLETDQGASTAENIGNFFDDNSENSRTSNISTRNEEQSKSLEAEPGDKDLNIKNMEIPGISTNRQPSSPLVHSEAATPLPAKKVKQIQHAEISIGENIHDSVEPEPESRTDSAKNIKRPVGDRTEPINSAASSQFQNTISFKQIVPEHPRLVTRSSISQRESFNSKTRTSPEASAKIEKLRQTFHEIAKKQSTLTKEQTFGINQPASQKAASPPPPSQPVIIYKRRPFRPKAPCAFWERNYMSRINIRTLR